jgi:hypothetical protein
MSFARQDLTKDASFFHDGVSPPKTVDGKGQRVFWQNCTVKVYDTSDPKEAILVYKSPDSREGEGVIPHGTSLWFGACDTSGGKIKEES